MTFNDAVLGALPFYRRWLVLFGDWIVRKASFQCLTSRQAEYRDVFSFDGEKIYTAIKIDGIWRTFTAKR